MSGGRRMRPRADDARETDPVHAVWAAPVLDDLAIPEPQDRRAVDGDARAGRRHVVVRAARVRPRERPVRHDEVVDFEENVHPELHVGERRLRHLPELVLLGPDVGPDCVRAHARSRMAHEVRREVLVHRLIIARGHPGAVFPEAGEVAAVRRTDGVSGLLRADDHGAAETSRAAVRKTMRRSLADPAVDLETTLQRGTDGEESTRVDDQLWSAARDDLVDLPVVVRDVELAARILAEAADVVDRERAGWIQIDSVVLEVLRVAAAHPHERADERRVEVGVEVPPVQIGHGTAAVYEAACDGLALFRLERAARGLRVRAVAVLENRERSPRRQAPARRLEAVATLHVVPAVVHARRVARAVVDFLPAALADISDVDVAVGAVEAEPEGVPQTLCPVGRR